LFVDVKVIQAWDLHRPDVLPSLKCLNHLQHCIQLLQSSLCGWLSNWNVCVKCLLSSQRNFTHTCMRARMFFKLFDCHFVTNLMNSLCMCSVQQM
jgi:hypothetical protein